MLFFFQAVRKRFSPRLMSELQFPRIPLKALFSRFPFLLFHPLTSFGQLWREDPVPGLSSWSVSLPSRTCSPPGSFYSPSTAWEEEKASYIHPYSSSWFRIPASPLLRRRLCRPIPGPLAVPFPRIRRRFFAPPLLKFFGYYFKTIFFLLQPEKIGILPSAQIGGAPVFSINCTLSS